MDHMRKRNHREVNPKNHYYDKFYIINYLELGKRWLDVLAEDFEDTMATFQDSDEEEEELVVSRCISISISLATPGASGKTTTLLWMRPEYCAWCATRTVKQSRRYWHIWRYVYFSFLNNVFRSLTNSTSLNRSKRTSCHSTIGPNS